MLSRSAVIAAALGLAVAQLSAAQSPAGTMDYFEGAVELIRADGVLDGESLSFGESLFDEETVRTGANGRAEISLARSGNTTVTVDGNTAYTISAPDGPTASRSGLRLLFGKVSLAVERSTGSESIEVQTNTAVFGVRGTEFDVLSSPDGAVLLGVREGEVVTRSNRGTTTAGAGQAVEVLPSGLFSRIDVPSGRMNDYYRAWLDLRADTFRRDPVFFATSYLLRYTDAEERFSEAAEELIAAAPAIRRMASESTGRGERMRLRGTLAPQVVAARSWLALHEESFYALSDLLNMLGAEALDTLAAEQRAALDAFQAAQPESLYRLARVKRLLRQYDAFQISIPSTR